MTRARNRIRALVLAGLLLLAGVAARSQQFNSDNYLSKPAGVATVILTYGQRNSMVMTTFSLIPNWEFTAAAYIFNSDNNSLTSDGYSTSFYFKWMLHENAAKNGGIAVKGGTGLEPGYLVSGVGLEDAWKSYWVNVPITLGFRQNTLSWDIMPGASYTKNYGAGAQPAWAFTYSTRLAWYPKDPKWALVGEVFGAEGEGYVPAEYKTGVRWEPNQYVTFAFTYGQEFNGTNGAGFETGMMLFTPPFFCITGCQPK